MKKEKLEYKKNVNKTFNAITLHLLLTCVIGILGTFLADYLSSINWFGDYQNRGGYIVWGAIGTVGTSGLFFFFFVLP